MSHDPHIDLKETIGTVDAELKQIASITVACAESCTGGLLSGSLTECSGSSSYFLGGVVAYHNNVKLDVLGVPEDTLLKHGAVSEACAIAMARGVAERLGATLAISTTGIAGPGGGTPTKPVGTVWLGWHFKESSGATLLQLSGTRSEIRNATVVAALRKIKQLIKES